MHKSITRVSVAVAAAAALSTLGVTGTSASSASTRAPQAAGKSLSGTSDAAAVPGAQLWITRYNGPGNSGDFARSVAVSPAGDKVFVTGEGPGATSRSDYATAAYSAATGARLWVSRYNGPGNGNDAATSVAVAHDGTKVFVTGSSWGGSASGNDYATVAYNASTGATLWVKRYNGPANGEDEASSVVSPGNGKVYVTGHLTAATGTD